ncbi:MAG TPA: permease-like cell division protein FtsX, partial [Oscillospiraceae bacterium]|nr:permease-like cell division protein FtsX [Oscillospiraceae bacterium]
HVRRNQKEVIFTVFYDQGVRGHDGDELGRQIRALDNVASAVFVSREQAYRETLDSIEPGLEEYFGEDSEETFPDSYKVTLKDMALFANTFEQLKALEGVESVRGSISLAEKIYSIRSRGMNFGIIVIVLLLLVSLFIVYNTIKITMHNRRFEIAIMRSVGATSAFIRFPFLLEGMFLGLLAAIFATFAVWGIYELAIRVLADIMVDLGGRKSLPFGNYAFTIFFGFCLIGLSTGLVGSMLSITKYLREKEFADYEEE